MFMLLANNTKVGITDSLLLSLIGIALTMAVLALLMGIIYAMSAILKKTDGIKIPFGKLLHKKTKTDAAEPAAPALAPGSAGQLKLNNVPPATAAMVMAIVADELKTPINRLRFTSIKEIPKKENE